MEQQQQQQQEEEEEGAAAARRRTGSSATTLAVKVRQAEHRSGAEWLLPSGRRPIYMQWKGRAANALDGGDGG